LRGEWRGEVGIEKGGGEEVHEPVTCYIEDDSLLSHGSNLGHEKDTEGHKTRLPLW